MSDKNWSPCHIIKKLLLFFDQYDDLQYVSTLEVQYWPRFELGEYFTSRVEKSSY